MASPSVRRLAGVGAVLGSVALVWVLGRAAPQQGTATTAEAIDAGTSMDWQREVDGLFGRTAIVRAEPLLDRLVVLDVTEGTSQPGYVAYSEDDQLEVGARPPVSVRAGFTGEGWLLRVISGAPLEWGVPQVNGLTVVFSGEGKTLVTTSDSICEMKLLESEWGDATEVPWADEILPGYPIPLWYEARSVVVELICEGITEIRSGQVTSLSAVFRLAGQSSG